MISFELESDQTLIQETVRAFAKDELATAARTAEKAGEPSAALRKSHAELGLAKLDLPESHGGQGASLCTTMVAEEELGWGDAPLAVALDGGYAAELLLSLAGKRSQGGEPTALAYCEPKGPAAGFATVARRADGGWLVTGKKGWVLDGARASRYVVFAQLEGVEGWRGAAAFLVARAGQKEGAIRVGEAQLIASGDALVDATRRTLARVGLKNAARQVGLGRAAYELALEYTQDRKAFGRPVAHFQANAFTLADMATEVDSARWLAWRTADRGVQLLGGAGFVQDFPAEKRMRDTKALALVGAPVEWWRLDAAAHHLGHAIDGALPSAAIQPFVL